MDKMRLSVLERRFFRKIYGPKKYEDTDEYEIRSNSDLTILFGKEDII